MISSFCNEEIEAVLISLALFLPNIVLAGEKADTLLNVKIL